MKTLDFIKELEGMGLTVKKRISNEFKGYDLGIYREDELLYIVSTGYNSFKVMDRENDEDDKVLGVIKEYDSTLDRGNDEYLEYIITKIPINFKRVYKNLYYLVEDFKDMKGFGNVYADGWRVGSEYEEYVRKVTEYSKDLSILENVEDSISLVDNTVIKNIWLDDKGNGIIETKGFKSLGEQYYPIRHMGKSYADFKIEGDEYLSYSGARSFLMKEGIGMLFKQEESLKDDIRIYDSGVWVF